MNITSFNGEINKLVNEIYDVLYFNHNKIKLKKLLNLKRDLSFDVELGIMKI